MVLYEEKEECCGCTACMSICTKQAITMQPDEEGFLYPQINSMLCTECKLCKKVCVLQNGYETAANLEAPDAYAVKHKDFETRMNSRSGGMFTAVSDYVLDKGGIVYGAGYKDHFVVCHKRATTKSERDEFRGSKYVQSELDDIFLLVKKDLQDDKWVLFSGTACQTAGLRAYLGSDDNKLILCDIICHGTPSPKVWKDYLSFMESRYKGTVSKVDFRNKKRFGWADHIESLEINGKEHDSRIYTVLFYKHDVLRPSCFNCKYTNMRRPADITLADFWGIDEAVADFNDNKGVSLVFLNTEEARRVFEEVKDSLDFEICTGKSFVHSSLKKPKTRPVNRNQFWADYQVYGFDRIVKNYAGDSFKVEVKKYVANVLKKLGLFGLARKILGREPKVEQIK